MNVFEELVAAKGGCVGCGYCCMKTPCWVAFRVYGYSIKECPALLWDTARYICVLIRDHPDIAKELYAGEGCCSRLNSWRKDVVRRDTV